MGIPRATPEGLEPAPADHANRPRSPEAAANVALPMVELRELQVFITLADELHFGRAAERLILTPSRVSQVVRVLEQRLGGKLFERSSRTVRLTTLGERFLADVRPPFDQLARAVARAHDVTGSVSGSLRVGFVFNVAGPPLTAVVEAFGSQYPDCRLTLVEVDVWEPYRPLRRGDIDVLVNWLAVDEPDLTVGPAIGSYERVLAVSRSHRLAQRTSVSVEDMGDETVNSPPQTCPQALVDAILPPFTPSGRPIRRVKLAENLHEVIALVAQGRIVHATMAGLAVYQRNDVVTLPITDLPPLPLGLIWVTAREDAKIRAIAAAANTLAAA
jgi:DNA-binding transcriptional LysR family regulator